MSPKQDLTWDLIAVSTFSRNVIAISLGSSGQDQGSNLSCRTSHLSEKAEHSAWKSLGLPHLPCSIHAPRGGRHRRAPDTLSGLAFRTLGGWGAPSHPRNWELVQARGYQPQPQPQPPHPCQWIRFSLLTRIHAGAPGRRKVTRGKEMSFSAWPKPFVKD